MQPQTVALSASLKCQDPPKVFPLPEELQPEKQKNVYSKWIHAKSSHLWRASLDFRSFLNRRFGNDGLTGHAGSIRGVEFRAIVSGQRSATPLRPVGISPFAIKRPSTAAGLQGLATISLVKDGLMGVLSVAPE